MLASNVAMLALFLFLQAFMATYSKHTGPIEPKFIGFNWSNFSRSFIEKFPTYCVDPNAIEIFQRRFKCIKQSSAEMEGQLLSTKNTFEYLRSHELVAHEFFMDIANPFRVSSCKEAEFEYIPLLPLHWITSSPNCPDSCSYAALIQDIISFAKYLKAHKSVEQLKADAELQSNSISNQNPIRFSVASTFNLRTAMGSGMPSQVRRGESYDLVTLFVTTLSLGHYERWPQCPDLLRKSWRYVTELPYRTYPIIPSTAANKRDITFLFAGRLQLWGPERVCSVRNFLTTLSDRTDTHIIEVTEEQSVGPPLQSIHSNYLRRSIFCLVTKADSYSTSFFYIALANGCIPIVISDWFVFAFPWFIRYEEFTIRILEEDFLSNPHQLLDMIKDSYGLPGSNSDNAVEGSDKLLSLQNGIKKWIPYLSFDKIDRNSKQYQLLKENIFEGNSNSYSNVRKDHVDNNNGNSILPLELLMYELRYSRYPESIHSAVPCYAPFKCTWNGKSLADISFIQPFHRPNPKQKNVRVKNSNSHQLYDNRTHLCKNSPRLIGHYKIVYFMQCVRILWPLTPGKLIKADLPVMIPDSNSNNAMQLIPQPVNRSKFVNGDEAIPDETLKYSQLDEEDLQFVLNFHALTNLSKSGRWQWSTYPRFPQEKYVKRID